MDECLIEKEDLSSRVKKVFGEEYIIKEITRLYGGTKKGTFKVDCTNEFSFILYIWDLRTTYFSNYQDKSNLFNQGGARLFAISEKVFEKEGIPTQKLYYINSTKEKYSFDYAFVQYIQGREIKRYIKEGHPSLAKHLERLSNEIKKLHSIKSQFAGLPEDLYENNFCCEGYILERIDNDIEYLIRNSKDVALGQKEIRNCYRNLYNKIKPRKEYVLIHGELGPNHVLVGDDDKMYFIDVDRVKYFDIEYEASFLEFKFGEYYKYLKEENLDIDRVNFYRFSHHISYLSGAYQLKETNYFEEQEIEKVIRHNLDEILKLI